MPMLDRAFSLSTQASLYFLSSLLQFSLCWICAFPFENSFGSNIVVIVHWQNMEMSMSHIEACGQHPNLLRLIKRLR